ncbi:MAG: DUF1501 domain-containing protein [Gammaproteobacteria bacterium]|nr:DUF1501 domain-containing protein [Gammaproteobacteria bacterium]
MPLNNRRDFLKLVYNLSIAGSAIPLIIPTKAYANSSPAFNNYKALVYVSLAGGNDAFNMVIPTNTSGGNSYNNYKSIRPTLAVKNIDLSTHLVTDANGNLDLTGGNPYTKHKPATAWLENADTYLAGFYPVNGTNVAINGVMPEVAHLMNTNKLAVIANVGTLVEPTTKTEIINETVKLPIYMFAHNHQSRIQQTGQADNKSIEGWVGRLYDEWSGVNGTDLLGNNASFAGYSYTLAGKTVEPLTMPTTPEGFQSRTQTDMREELYNLNEVNPFLNLYNRMINRSFDLSSKIANVWNNAYTYSSTDAYGGSLFSIPSRDYLQLKQSPDGTLIEQLEAVSKMIDYGRNNGIKRQVFFVELPGFDSHGSQLENHPKYLRELSLALSKFQTAMEELGASDEVTTFTLSDFGRTAASNGDGTDHAWGGHNLVMGGAVKGGMVYGQMPDLTPGGNQDYGRNGRIIPAISVDQQLSTLTKWFGVEDTLIEKLFPNISNFDSTTYGRDIGFMG